MDKIDFELKLVDGVSATAKRAADAVGELEKKSKKTKKALDFGAELEKAEHQLKRLQFDPAGYRKLLHAQREISEERKRLGKESFFGAFSEKLDFTNLVSAAAIGDLFAEGIMKVGEGLMEVAHKFVEFIADGVIDAFKEAGKEQTQRIGEKLSLGAVGGKEFREDAQRFSGLTGFNPGEIRRLILPMRRAGFSQESTRQALATANDIAAGQGRGGDLGAVQSTLEAFQRLKVKGGIGKRQLVEMLGDTGNTVPDFYKALGKKIGISAKAAEKKLEQGGKIDPQLVMNMITTSVNMKQGGPAGNGGKEYAKGFEATLHHLGGLQERFFEELVESPGFERANEMLQGLLEKLDPATPTGQRIMAAVEGMFDKITELIGDPDEAASNLASGIEQTIILIGDMISAARDIADALLPSLNTIEDMIIGMRMFIAVSTQNQSALEAAAKDQTAAMYRRGIDAAVKQNRKQGWYVGGSTSGGTTAGSIVPMASPMVSAMASVGKGVDKTINIQAPQYLTVNGGDPEAVKQASADGHQHGVQLYEQAANTGG